MSSANAPISLMILINFKKDRIIYQNQILSNFIFVDLHREMSEQCDIIPTNFDPCLIKCKQYYGCILCYMIHFK